jgi:hypothetical protein
MFVCAAYPAGEAGKRRGEILDRVAEKAVMYRAR